VGAPAGKGLAVAWGGFAEIGLSRDFRAMSEDGLPNEQWWGYRMNVPLPDGTDPAAATMVITWRETLSYVRRLGVAPADRVLVIGSGGNALSIAAHVARLCGHGPAMVGSAARSEAARRAGASALHDYKAANPAAILAEDAPDGFDVVIDAVGRIETLEMALPLVKSGGVVSVYGLDDFGRLRLDPARARGAFTYKPPNYDEPEFHGEVVEAMRRGLLDASIWLDLGRPYPLADIVQAYAAAQSRRCIKALVKIQ
jgi:L-iditol 2-dehydrogenase